MSRVDRRTARRLPSARIAGCLAASALAACGGATDEVQGEEAPAPEVAVGEAAPAETPPAGASTAATTGEEAETKPDTFVVREVTDGDTIVLANGKRVRLVQIDAPELREGECYAEESRATLVELLPPGTAKVRLEHDPALDDIDRYGRELAYAFKGEENVNHSLVVRGAASVWFYEEAKGKYASDLDQAARQARADGRGLWGACPGTRYDPLDALETKVPAPPPRAVPEPARCHPSYEGECLDRAVSDYDCAGGSGDGPGYVQGTVRVVGPDEYRLDGDGDGDACE